MVDEKKEYTEENDDMYNEKNVEDLMDKDEINPEEAAFMEGYTEGEGVVKCANCGKPVDLDTAQEETIRDKVVRFCSEACAKHYNKHH